ncbi:MAG: hypothetical protein WBF90_07210 [Rivularia sp. (in: cyanobacteria)]|jgi:hypothetical protein
MSELTKALNRILNWFQHNKPSTIESLQPGLTIEEIEEKVKDLPFRLTQEVYQLYQWRNGMIDDGSCFFRYYRFLPLEDALEELKLMKEAWSLSLPFGWFALFEFEGEYFSAVGAEENTENSPILHTYHGIDIAYRNLTNMMLYIAECYETGACYIDESGDFEENEIAQNIYRKYEPELNPINKAKVEVVDNSDGSQIINKYHFDSNIIIESEMIDRKGNTIESSQYFQGKLYNRITYNREVEGFYEYLCKKQWFNDYEKYEIFSVEYQYKCVAPKIERRYINGVLKKEIIHPDRKRDNFFLVFALFLGIFQFIFSILFFIYHSLRYKQQKQ